MASPELTVEVAENKISVRALDDSEGLGLKTMAEHSGKPNELELILKPFYQRASAAEDRLARLEAALASQRVDGENELLKTISELQSTLEAANAAVLSERKKSEMLAAENEKLKYRVKHLVRAVEEADLKMESMFGCNSEPITDTVSKLKDVKL